jgi:ATP-dependent helicase/nuclease subunit B
MDEAAKCWLPRTVAEALAHGATVLTPNQRAAHALRQAFTHDMRADGIPRWTPPEIHALDSWGTQLWHQMTLVGNTSRLLLSPAQEHTLWRSILATDPGVSSLRSHDSLADMAASAWHLLWSYRGRARIREAGISTDTKAFQRWASSFEENLQRSNLLSAAQLPATLSEAFSRSRLPVPNNGLLLVDFDLLLPAWAELFDSLGQAGIRVDDLRTSAPSSSALACTAPNERSELQSAASWIRDRLRHDLQARIAVVVPNLADRRHEIARVFGHILAPDAERVTSSAAPPFEFSLGVPLAETPLAATALDLLRWTLAPLPLASITELLLSPHFGAASPAEQRAAAEFDAEDLRQAPLLRPEFSLDATTGLVESSRRAARFPSLIHRMRALRQAAHAAHLQDPAHNQAHAAWADTFRGLLDAAGWTRSAASSSLAFQTHRRFESALDELATLDFDGSHASASDALAALTRIAQQAIFAPESSNAPVQILGPLEVGGVPFDALWFLGAGDLAWPQSHSPSPLLPFHLQRSLGVPGTSPERDHAAALDLTNRIALSATETVFSFATQCNEGEQRPSAVLAGLNLQPLLETFTPKQHSPIHLVPFEDDIPIPLPPDRTAPGGAQILQLQAACAFRAFAEHRLFSTAPEQRQPGLDALDRGSIVHRVMEHFWNRVQDQSELRALPLGERDAILDQAIAHALETPGRIAESTWDAAYLEAERLRLRNLLRPWLDQELKRPAFAVRQNEGRREIQLGPLRLSLRVDRIDETVAGPLILDYKTGNATPSQWLSDRPDAPQLPLYAVISREPIAGVAFALLRAGNELCLKGFADSEDIFGTPAKMSLPLADQVERWRETLTSLAQDFFDGHAEVAPRSYPQTCAYCAHRILCRLNPAVLDQLADDPEDNTDV